MVFNNNAVSVMNYLLSKTTASTRVYVEGLPTPDFLVHDSVLSNQLQGTIVISNVPGSTDAYLPVAYPRLHIRCYNKDKQAASALWFQMLNLLHNVTIDDAQGRVVMWLNGGPICDVDPDTKFCYAEGYFLGTSLGK